MVGRLLVALAVGWSLGTVPSAHLVGRLAGVDVLRSGSGNMGASNLARTVGYPAAAAAFALDVGKSLGAVLIGGTLGEWPQVAAAVGAVAGHNWTPWLGFRGGRGLGIILATGLVVAPWATLALVGLLAAGVAMRSLGLLAGIGLCGYPAVAAVADGGAAAVFAGVALALSAVRRLQGSPQRSGARLAEAWRTRLLFDREPPSPP